MIELLPDMPEGVTGIRVTGHLTGDELRGVKPQITEALGAGKEIRIVEIIDDDYHGFGPGGLVEDLKLGLGTVLPNHGAFTRIAIVTDKEWVARTLHAISWLVPGELAVFGLNEVEQATQWAAGRT
jgi:hypothetical protein